MLPPGQLQLTYSHPQIRHGEIAVRRTLDLSLVVSERGSSNANKAIGCYPLKSRPQQNLIRPPVSRYPLHTSFSAYLGSSFGPLVPLLVLPSAILVSGRAISAFDYLLAWGISRIPTARPDDIPYCSIYVPSVSGGQQSDFVDPFEVEYELNPVMWRTSLASPAAHEKIGKWDQLCSPPVASNTTAASG